MQSDRRAIIPPTVRTRVRDQTGRCWRRLPISFHQQLTARVLQDDERRANDVLVPLEAACFVRSWPRSAAPGRASWYRSNTTAGIDIN